MKAPEDFPWKTPPVVSGAQPKLAARLDDGKYVVGETAAERDVRWDYYEDLAQQLVKPALKDSEKRPENSHEKTLQRVKKTVADKGWVEGDAEMGWLIQRLRVLLGW